MTPFEIDRDGAVLFSYFNQGEFECSDGRGCVVDRLRCNGVHDCLDKSDEVGCGDGSSGIGSIVHILLPFTRSGH